MRLLTYFSFVIYRSLKQDGISDPDLRQMRMINVFVLVVLEQLEDGKKVMIQCTRYFSLSLPYSLVLLITVYSTINRALHHKKEGLTCSFFTSTIDPSLQFVEVAKEVIEEEAVVPAPAPKSSKSTKATPASSKATASVASGSTRSTGRSTKSKAAKETEVEVEVEPEVEAEEEVEEEKGEVSVSLL